MRLTIVALPLLISTFACGRIDVGSPDASSAVPDAGSSGSDAGVDAGPADGGAPDAGTTATVRVLTDLRLAGHPHTIDAFIPTNAERVIVFLHGGGGTKETGASRE